jgi:lysophospholipid hydrolase
VELATLESHSMHQPNIPNVEHKSSVPPLKGLKDLRNRLQAEYNKFQGVYPSRNLSRPHNMSDFARLARRLCGKSIGLVLGGGGARGIAHVGVIRSLLEREIPIDIVGGTSIGALVGGLFAREGELVSTLGRLKRFSGRMSTLWRLLTDVTYPVVAYT